MNLFTPIQNLKLFLINGPPSVIFTLCLTLFAIIAFSFACFISGNIFITDPMATIDWNIFLNDLTENEFCILNNHEMKSHFSPLSMQSHNQSSKQEILVSVSAVFSLYWSSAQNFDASAISTQMMNLKNAIGKNKNISVGINFIGERNASSCSLESNICHINQATCVTFYGPKSFFPQTRMPPSCAPSFSNNTTYSFTYGPLMTISPEVKNSSGFLNSAQCSHGTILQMKYQSDPNLSVMLSMHERSIINLHLMYTFYFFLVMVISIFCWASVRGRGKTVDLNKVNFEKISSLN